MNKHRAYWSAMGLEPKSKPDISIEKRKALKSAIKDFIVLNPTKDSEKFSEVCEILRELKKELEI